HRAILKELGLQREISASQARRKWENLKMKYKEMKNPPPGVSVNPTNWPWFSLMDDAMEDTSTVGDDSEYRPNNTTRRRSKRAREPDRSEIELFVEEDDMMSEEMGRDRVELDRDRDEMEHERAILESDKAAIEYERMVLEREKMVLDRERAGVERELAALDRDRASLEREKAAVERDRASVEYIRAQLEKERAILDRERAKLERERAILEQQHGTEKGEQMANLNDSTEKFLNLFEKLIENF
uniref:Si:dkeyp-38g8.5 n=1 Tax=Cyprinus carpio TaxID=7962 RepID=A0A8C1ZM90_CYPCA